VDQKWNLILMLAGQCGVLFRITAEVILKIMAGFFCEREKNTC
jgi:hypothetical protein